MTMKEIWELLETEPTSDKRVIKHAYAKAVKKYHPEENPEEFQKVYTAYQQALAYAKHAGMRQESQDVFQINQTAQQDMPEKKNEGIEETDSEEQKRIRQMFSDIKNEQEKKLFIFRHKWEWYLKNQNKDSAKKEMLAYIKTPWFTEIKEDIRLLYTLEEYRLHHQALLYLLEEDEKHFLYQDIEKWQRMEQPPVQKKKVSFKRIAAVILSIAAVVLVNIFAYMPKKSDSGSSVGSIDVEREKENILSFLQETYPMAEFTEIESSQIIDSYFEEFNKYGGGNAYTVHVANSDIVVNVFAAYKDGRMFIGEDFGRQYLRQLAEKQDILCDLCHIEQPWNDGDSHYLMVGYFEIDAQLDQLERDLNTFMERFLEFAMSGEVREFVNIEGVSFCVGNCFQPTAFFMDAGEMPKPLLYDFADLPGAEVMAEDMKYAVAEYYIHMEPWQLEQIPQYEDWLNWYEEKVKKRGEKPTTPVGSSIVTLAEEAGVQALIYQQGVLDCISTGDMYRLLKKSGVSVTVLDGGGGFEAKDGGSYFTGTVPCEKVLELFDIE